MINLVGGTNFEGYDIALQKSFDFLEYDDAIIPSKSAFCQFRQTVSYEFFRDQYTDLIKQNEHNRPKYKGFKISAVDGDQYYLPRTDDLESNEYKGHSCENSRETYYLKMYVSLVVDCITGVPVNFFYSNSLNENEIAEKQYIPSTKKDEISIYDRLYLSEELINAHYSANSYFIARTKIKSTFKCIDEFCNGELNSVDVTINRHNVRLIKVNYNDSIYTFCTNIPKEIMSDEEISTLYRYRWEVETCNKSLTHIMKIEQFHTGFLNGILQEIYTSLWLNAFIKIIISSQTNMEKDFYNKIYKRSNFKLLFVKMVSIFWKFLFGNKDEFIINITKLVLNYRETRKRYSRSYPRETKQSDKNKYPRRSTIPQKTSPPKT
jgi:hypothetical protein